MGEIVMPRLTDSMEEGTIVAWLKANGDPVSVGDELVEIETDKASMVYESDLAGELNIEVEEGETRPIGEKIATIGGGGTAESANGPGAAAATVAGNQAGAGPAVEDPASGAGLVPDSRSQGPPGPAPAGSGPAASEGGSRVKASPLARRMASDRGIELGAVSGSGPNGRIVKADVERAANGPADGSGPSAEAGKGSVETVELTRLQKTVSRRMAESMATAPHFYLRAEIDMSRAVEVRSGFKETAVGDEPVPSLNDMVVKAVATALTHHPRANAAYRDGRFELYSRINVGIAVAADDALVVPTIGDTDRKDLRQIASESRRLAERVRTGEITPPELSGGTFTVSNLGMFGIRSFDAVINSGQAGILAVGEIAERPVVREGRLTAAHLMEVSLACDHRILYGAEGAEFLGEIRRYLEEPGLLA